MGVDEEPTKLPTTVQEASEGEAKRPDAAKDQLENTDATGKAMLESVAQRRTGFLVFFKDVRHALKLDEMGREIARIAVPAALALAADPLASLVDTAFIGRIGEIELAAVGVSIAIFNQVSKIAIYPIVSVTTSFVAEEHAAYAGGISGEENEDIEKPSAGIDSKMGYSSSLVDNGTTARRFGYKRIHIPSVSSALVVGGVLGFLQASHTTHICSEAILTHHGSKACEISSVLPTSYLL